MSRASGWDDAEPYPTSRPQTIPTFSLLWVGMLRD